MAEPAQTRQRVLDAARELFAARGFHGTTMREIAQRAGVNLAAAHYHFGAKDALYLDVLRAQFSDVTAQLAARGARVDVGAVRPSRRALRALLRARIGAMLELLLGPPPSLHGTLMMREMIDPSAALPHIVEQFIRPQQREMAALVGGLFPTLGTADVERCVFSIVGQVFFYRQTLPALTAMIGADPLRRTWLRTTAEHIAAFSLGGMQRLAAARRRSRR
jgi:AcrR family transcriptional regulator